MKYLILLLLSFNLSAGDWSKEDQQRQLVYTFIHVLDWGQTLDMLDKYDRYYERNILLGDYPIRSKINTFMTLSIIGHWTIAKRLKLRNRRKFQVITTSIRGLVVSRNHYIGLNVNF